MVRRRNEGRGPKPVAPFNDGAQKIATPTGLPYGENSALTAQQHAAPLPLAAPSAPNAAQPAPANPLADAQAMDFRPGNLMAPSSRPNEPVTAGLPTGAGPGPEALASLPGGGLPGLPADPAAFLRAIYDVAPTPDLADMIHHFQGF